MNFLRSTLADLDLIARLFDDYRVFFKAESDPKGSYEFLKRHLQKRTSLLFHVEKAGRPIAFAQVYPIYSSVDMCPVWLLNDFFIDQDFRKQGVGDYLLRSVHEEACKSEVPRILLETTRENVAAQKLYQKIGYKFVENHFFHYDF